MVLNLLPAFKIISVLYALCGLLEYVMNAVGGII